MSFHEVLFPTDISFGTKGGPTYSTKVVTLVSGQVQKVPRWSSPQFRYDVAERVKSLAAWSTLKTFYIARLGPANGFLFKDWAHFSSASDHRAAPTNADQNIGTGDGTATAFQLRKAYTSGLATVYKNIYKPVVSTILIAVNGVAKSSPADFTVDTTTGIVTFSVAPPAAQAVTAGYYFYMPVMFAEELDQTFLFNHEEYDIGSIDSVQLVEVIDPLSADEEFYYGGAADLSPSTNISITSLTGRVIRITPSAAMTVFLPQPAGYPLGGVHWYIENIGAFSITFKVGITTQFTLTAGSKIMIVNALVGTTPTWKAF